jgi:uncharacterized membrane protein YeaQ/YmgE (transglycosylase-associated protein family)
MRAAHASPSGPRAGAGDGEEVGMALMSVTVTVTFSDLVVWLIVGALAGVVIGQAMAGRLLPIIGDLIVGALGGLLLNLIVGYFLDLGPYGLLGRIVVAIIGAAILIAIAHATRVSDRYPFRRRATI